MAVSQQAKTVRKVNSKASKQQLPLDDTFTSLASNYNDNLASASSSPIELPDEDNSKLVNGGDLCAYTGTAVLSVGCMPNATRSRSSLASSAFLLLTSTLSFSRGVIRTTSQTSLGETLMSRLLSTFPPLFAVAACRFSSIPSMSAIAGGLTTVLRAPGLLGRWHMNRCTLW